MSYSLSDFPALLHYPWGKACFPGFPRCALWTGEFAGTGKAGVSNVKKQAGSVQMSYILKTKEKENSPYPRPPSGKGGGVGGVGGVLNIRPAGPVQSGP